MCAKQALFNRATPIAQQSLEPARLELEGRKRLSGYIHKLDATVLRHIVSSPRMHWKEMSLQLPTGTLLQRPEEHILWCLGSGWHGAVKCHQCTCGQCHVATPGGLKSTQTEQQGQISVYIRE